MNKPIVIALLARAGSGKTTAANYLVEKYGATRVSFAGPLKEICRRVIGLGDAQLFGDKKEQIIPGHGITPRVYMQRMGNEARNIIGPTVWIDAAINTILNEFREEGREIFVIDDCRYVNEADAIATNPNIVGHVVKIECPDRESSADQNHPSEREVDIVEEEVLTRTIRNKIADGVEPLYAHLEALMNEDIK